MTRYSTRPPPRFPKLRSPDEPEPMVVRPGEEPSWAEEMLENAGDPREPLSHRLAVRLHGQLSAGLEDEAFLISMRNRLRMLDRERSAPAFWRRIKGLLFGAPEKNEVTGFELKRLKRMAGEMPPDPLPDNRYVDLPYEELRRLVAAGEAGLAEPQDEAG